MKTTKSEATKGTWETAHSQIMETTQNYSNGKLICTINYEDVETEQEAEANAELIVKAVNNFEPMLEALKEVSPFIDKLILDTPTGLARDILTGLNIKVKSAILNADK